MMRSRGYLALMWRWAAQQAERFSVVGAGLVDGICGDLNER